MAREVIHISDTDAVNDFESLLAKVRTGAEIVIEHNSRPVAIVKPATEQIGRTLSESIELAKAHAKQLGYTPMVTPEFAADIEEIINMNREPFDPPSWD